MSSDRDQVISEFLEVYLDDDQLWAAGGAADIQRLLMENIDDRGRINGKAILNFLVTRGVPTSAARAAMDRFVAKRRAALAASRGAGAAPKASSTGAPRASGVPRASGIARASTADSNITSRSGIGVTSAAAARERSQAAMRAPPMPGGSSTLPWGGKVEEPDTDATHVHGGYDEEATQISEAFSGERSTSMPSQPAETSSPGRLPPSAIRGAVPRAPVATPTAPTPPAATPTAAMPPMMLDPSALTEITDPSRATPSGEARKRSASEIRGAPIAAAAAASTSGPNVRPSSAPRPSGPPSAFAGPPSALAGGPPSALAGSPSGAKQSKREKKRAAKRALAGDMADALGITARKEAEAEEARQQAIKEDHTLARVERNPEEEKGPVHPGVFLAALGVLATGVSLFWLISKPPPTPVAFTASQNALPCHNPTASDGELVCHLPLQAVAQDQGVLRRRLAASRSDAKAAGYNGVWFFLEETERPWAPSHVLWSATGPQGASTGATTKKQPPGDGKQLPTEEGDGVDDILNGLTPDAVPQATPDAPEVDDDASSDDGDAVEAAPEAKPEKKKRKRRKARRKRKRK